MSRLTYTNWNPGEPSYGYWRGEHEVCMQIPSGYRYRWNDVVCSYEGCSICELDIRSQ